MAKGYLLQRDDSGTPLGASQWVKVTKTSADFAAAALTNTLTLFTPAANEVITGVTIYVPTAFLGGTIATYTFTVSWGAQAIIAATNVLTPAIGTSGFVATVAIILGNADGGAKTLTCLATSTVGLLNAATQGNVTFEILVSTQP